MFNLDKELALVEAILKDYNSLMAGVPVIVGPYTEDINIGGKTFEVTESLTLKLKT